MTPWLANREWLQVILLSVYLLGATVTGGIVARQPAESSETQLEAAGAVTLAAILWPAIAVIAAPLGLCWMIAKALGAYR